MSRTMTFNRLLISTATLFLFILFSVTLLHASILVVAPHPDDDAIMASGIVYRAVERAEPVRIVYITNGDYYGAVYNGNTYNGIQTGLIRQGEGVTGQSILGVPENNLMFLGYPDGYLQTIYDNYPTGVYTTPNNNQSTTYGNRGLGLTDYHNYRFSSHADYNRTNIIADLSDIIDTFRPDHIFVTSEFDYTTDHVTTYRLVHDAATSFCNSHPGYNPVIHKTIIWWAAEYWWPNLPIVWPNSPDPTVPLAEIPNLFSSTGLVWNNRESFDVPLLLQSPNYVNNPKALALNSHLIGQKGVFGYIGFFLHKDEVFWPEVVVGTNHPPVVNAGSDQTVMQGSGTVQLDGTHSSDPDSDPLTYQWVQRSGTSVVLSNATSVSPSFTVPTGLTQNDVLTFELTVSDGHFTTIPDSVSVNVLTTLPDTINIAPLATVTASSENSADGQSAAKAVDGVVDGFLGDGGLQVDGYPGDGSREWSSFGETNGAWLHLAWSVPYSVDRIVLHDRINLGDNITSATITFSDSSSINVGPLNNNGTSTVYTFPAKVITSLTMTVTGVSSNTFEIGLAEMEVFGVSTVGTFTVTPSAGAHGSISPNTPQTVNFGSTQAFTVTPTSNYHIASVNGCGGALVGNTYTTGPIAGDCSVSATFAIDTFAITTSSGANGSISCSPNPVNYGSDSTCAITPDTGYHIASVTVDSVGQSSSSPYLFTSVHATHTIEATFAINTFTVTPSAGANGSLSPATPQTVNYNATQAFTVTPSTGYHIVSVTGCGGSLVSTTYTTAAVTADCTVTATFAINTYDLTANATGTGSGTVSSDSGGINYTYPAVTTGLASINDATTVTLTATAVAGSTVTWSGNCDSTGGTSTIATCIITSMNAARTVTANFALSCLTQLVKNENIPDYYTSINTAYGVAREGDTLMAVSYEFAENLNLTHGINIILKGGYGCDYSSNPGYTTLNGVLTIQADTLTVENIIIK